MRGKFRALLQRKCPDLVIPETVWQRPWILHVTAWGKGEQAVLDYLARYVFRIALTNARILGLDDETVTIQFKERKTGQARTCRLSGEEFMRRFLQHVLPRGFHKVRYYGLWHPAHRDDAARVRQMTPQGSARCCNSKRHPNPIRCRNPASRRQSRSTQSQCRRPNR